MRWVILRRMFFVSAALAAPAEDANDEDAGVTFRDTCLIWARQARSIGRGCRR